MDRPFGILGGRFGISEAGGCQGTRFVDPLSRNERSSGFAALLSETGVLVLPCAALSSFYVSTIFWWRQHTERFLCMAL